MRKVIDWALDKTSDVAVGAYGLLTGESWVKAVNGKLLIPGAARLVLYTLFLVVAWIIIGIFKGKLEEK